MTGVARSGTLSRFFALAVVALMVSGGDVHAQPKPADPDWPCVQQLLPEIVGGMVWTGPALDEVDVPDDAGMDALAGELAARRVPIEEAEGQISAFAETLQADARPTTLASLFKTTLSIINHDRTSIITGIKKFSRGQRTLADKINAKNLEIEQIDRSDLLKRDTAMAERDWDIRIFEDRRQSLAYLCEQPVLLEQRAFALARSMASQWD